MCSPWPTVPACEVARIEIGGTPSRNTPVFWAEENSGHPWVSIADMNSPVVTKTHERITDAGVNRSNVKLVPAGTPLMSFKLTVGRVAIAGCDLYTNEAIAAFHVDHSAISPRWLVHILPGAASKVVTDTAVKGITLNKAKLRLLPLPLPPLPEQRRIAEILDTVDEAIRKTEEIIAKLERMKQGLLHDLLTRGIDENGELRDPDRHPERFKESELGRVPKEWEVAQIHEVGSVQLGRQRSPRYEKGPHLRPYLRVANVFDGFIDYTDVLRMNFSLAEQEQYAVSQGDILLNEGQSIELVGRCAIYDGPPGLYCFQNTLVRFRPRSRKLDVHFARAVFKRWLDIGRFRTVARQTTSVAHLGAERFARMCFPLPSPLEQAGISRTLRQYDERVSVEARTANKLRLLKQALMNDLLTGKVRVPVSEEAAS